MILCSSIAKYFTLLIEVFFFFNGAPQLLFLSIMNSSGASLAGLTVEEMTLNSSFRKKHL